MYSARPLSDTLNIIQSLAVPLTDGALSVGPFANLRLFRKDVSIST